MPAGVVFVTSLILVLSPIQVMLHLVCSHSIHCIRGMHEGTVEVLFPWGVGMLGMGCWLLGWVFLAVGGSRPLRTEYASW